MHDKVIAWSLPTTPLSVLLCIFIFILNVILPKECLEKLLTTNFKL